MVPGRDTDLRRAPLQPELESTLWKPILQPLSNEPQSNDFCAQPADRRVVFRLRCFPNNPKLSRSGSHSRLFTRGRDHVAEGLREEPSTEPSGTTRSSPAAASDSSQRLRTLNFKSLPHRARRVLEFRRSTETHFSKMPSGVRACVRAWLSSRSEVKRCATSVSQPTASIPSMLPRAGARCMQLLLG